MPRRKPQQPIRPPSTPPQRWRDFLLATVTALLIAAPVFVESLWSDLIGLVPLFLALRDVSPQRAFLLGWWAETLMIWIGFYWLVGTMVRFGFIPLLSLLLLGSLVSATASAWGSSPGGYATAWPLSSPGGTGPPASLCLRDPGLPLPTGVSVVSWFYTVPSPTGHPDCRCDRYLWHHVSPRGL